MKINLSILIGLLFTNILISQNISSNFKTELRFQKVILSFDQETEFDYCLEGEIFFYNTSNGKVISTGAYNSTLLQSYVLPLNDVLQPDNSILFNILLDDCSDIKRRILNNSGFIDFETQEEKMKLLKSSYAIKITLDEESVAHVKFLESVKQKEDQRQAKSAQELIVNEKRIISKGDLLFICNGGTPCQVLKSKLNSLNNAGQRVEVGSRDGHTSHKGMKDG